MSGIAGIFNVPVTPDELAAWATVHARHHHDIIRSIYESSGGATVLPEYVLEPINPNDTGAWASQHRIMHENMDAVLGIEGYDLSSVDFKNTEKLTHWIRLNATEHLQAADILRLSVSVIPTQIVTSAFTARAENSGVSSSYSFGGLSFGAPAINRFVVAGVAWQSSASLASATIGGISAVNLVQCNPNVRRAAIIMAPVPLGATGTVNINLAGSAANCSVAIYSLVGVVEIGASIVASALASNPSVTLAVAAHGAVIAVATNGFVPPPSSSWIGLTEDCDNNYGISNFQVRSSASKNFDTFQSALPVTCAFSGSTGGAGCFAVFNP